MAIHIFIIACSLLGIIISIILFILIIGFFMYLDKNDYFEDAIEMLEDKLFKILETIENKINKKK